MQTYYNTLPFFKFKPIQKPIVPYQHYQTLLTFTDELKQVIAKQQSFIDALRVKQQQTEEQLLHSLEQQQTNFAYIKQEYDEISINEVSGAIGDCKQEYEDAMERPKIMRRNGFKSLNSDTESASSGKSKKSKRIPSKAKHLWINYGRRIIEYAMENSERQVQGKISKLFGRLNTKKDYREVFGLAITDSEEERQFKIKLGAIAIDFVKNKSAMAFEGIRHKDEMIAQWNAVAIFIEKLIHH